MESLTTSRIQLNPGGKSGLNRRFVQRRRGHQGMVLLLARLVHDKRRPPQRLQDLVDEHYLQEIPTDASTGKKDWVPHYGNVTVGTGETLYGIDDVHSSTSRQEPWVMPD